MYKVMGRHKDENYFLCLDREIPLREEASKIAMAMFLDSDRFVEVTIERDIGHSVDNEPKVLTRIVRIH
ncbi:hypothetical protein SmphiM6_116 [Sinorhizobium phage phiM6]|nr:hypothetical protein SmphiM6_116 [Sinorhizobium phage phiM6]